MGYCWWKRDIYIRQNATLPHVSGLCFRSSTFPLDMLWIVFLFIHLLLKKECNQFHYSFCNYIWLDSKFRRCKCTRILGICDHIAENCIQKWNCLLHWAIIQQNTNNHLFPEKFVNTQVVENHTSCPYHGFRECICTTSQQQMTKWPPSYFSCYM